MALDVASNYAATFRPQEPVLAGFNLALSSSGSDLLSGIPAQNAAIDSALAQAALGQIGASARQRLTTDAELRLEEQTRRSNRRASAMKMLSSILEGGSGLLQPPASRGRVDPYSTLTGVNNYLDLEASQRTGDTARSNAMMQNTLKQLFS